MGVQQLMVLLAMLLLSFSPASFSRLTNNLVSENMHGNMGDKGIDENNSRLGGNSPMVRQSKHTTVLTGGAGGGRPGGNGDQSNSSPQGGNGVVPAVYTAGAAAGQRRNHKGDAATCSPSWKGGFAVLMATISASLLLHIPV